jgi:hypothetical protein
LHAFHAALERAEQIIFSNALNARYVNLTYAILSCMVALMVLLALGCWRSRTPRGLIIMTPEQQAKLLVFVEKVAQYVTPTDKEQIEEYREQERSGDDTAEMSDEEIAEEIMCDLESDRAYEEACIFFDEIRDARALLEEIRNPVHVKVGAGLCPVCGHYGEDCTASAP